MAEKGNTHAKGNVPGPYRTACSNSSQMGEFTGDTWQVHSEQVLTTKSVITAQGRKSPAKRLGNLQLVSRGCSLQITPYGQTLTWEEKKPKVESKEKKQNVYEVMLLGRRMIQQKGWLGCSHPTLKAQWGPTRSSMQGQTQPLRISNWRVIQTSGSSNTHLMLQKTEPHFFKRLLVCLKTELQTVSKTHWCR